MNQATAILMDRREPEGIFDGFHRIGYRVTLGELLTGDYQWTVVQETDSGDHRLVEVLVERASWSNLLEKMSSGELAAQARRMVEGSTKWPRLNYLLIEGTVTVTDGYLTLQGSHWKTREIQTRWQYSSVQGYLTTLQLHGIMLVFSPRLEDTPRAIAQLYEYTRKQEHEALNTPYRPVQTSLRPPSPEEMVLMGVPGIGLETAREILVNCKSIARLLCALNDAPKIVEQIKGVGPSRIRSLRSVFFGPEDTQEIEERERAERAAARNQKVVSISARRKKVE